VSIPTLGDLTQIPVTSHPTQGLPALGDTTVTLYNQDITNVVYASYQQWFAPGQGNSIPIQPLGSITISAKKAIYVAALVSVSPLLVLPEGSAVQPSPAQIAAQINALGLAKETTQLAGNTTLTAVSGSTSTVATNTTGVAKDTTVSTVNTTLGAPAQDSIRTAIPNNIATTGVPLLTKATSLGNQTTLTAIAGGSGFVTILNAVPVSQIGYEFQFTTQQTSAAAVFPLLEIELRWSDSVTGAIVAIDHFYTSGLNQAASHALTTVGTGPTKGDTLTARINNINLAPMNYTFTAAQNSRLYQRDDWRWTGYTGSGSGAVFNGVTNPQYSETEQGLLVADTATVAATTTATKVIPLYGGNVWLHCDELGVTPPNMQLQIMTQGAFNAGFLTQSLFSAQLGGGPNGSEPNGPVNVQIALPRSPCLFVMTNNGAVNAVINTMITIAEQPS
jgi:hypothetical protein